MIGKRRALRWALLGHGHRVADWLARRSHARGRLLAVELQAFGQWCEEQLAHPTQGSPRARRGKCRQAIAARLKGVVVATCDGWATAVVALFDLSGATLASTLAGILGLLCGSTKLMRLALTEIVAVAVGATLAIAGKAIAWLQVAIGLQQGARRLTSDEEAQLAQVYRQSLDLRHVRVIEGFAGLFSINNRAFVLGEHIYLKNVKSCTRPDVLIHEGCHVWQYQHDGVNYIGQAIWAQTMIDQPYHWQGECQRGHQRWQDFNLEAQAQFLQDVYAQGSLVATVGRMGEFYCDEPLAQTAVFRCDDVDFSGLAHESVACLRGRYLGEKWRILPFDES